MFNSRNRGKIISFCIFHCFCIHDLGNGPAMLLPYSFCPRDHVKNAGPLNQDRISMSRNPHCRNTLYCISSCPDKARILFMPIKLAQSKNASHDVASYHTKLYECVQTFIKYDQRKRRCFRINGLLRGKAGQSVLAVAVSAESVLLLILIIDKRRTLPPIRFHPNEKLQ